MKSRHVPVLLLAAALGCTQGSAPPPDADIVQTVPGADLPDPAATLIKFSCPGMT